MRGERVEKLPPKDAKSMNLHLGRIILSPKLTDRLTQIREDEIVRIIHVGGTN